MSREKWGTRKGTGEIDEIIESVFCRLRDESK